MAEEYRQFYQNFESIHNETHGGLVAALSVPLVRPKLHFNGTGLFYKNYSQLTTDITDYFISKGMDLDPKFKEDLFFSFRENPKGGKPVKKALLEIEYGRIWGQQVPEKIFETFDDGWDAVYFHAGMWLGKNVNYFYTEKKLKAWKVSHTVAKTMDMGIRVLNKHEKLLKKKLPRRKKIQAKVDYVLDPHRDQIELDGIVRQNT